MLIFLSAFNILPPVSSHNDNVNCFLFTQHLNNFTMSHLCLHYILGTNSKWLTISNNFFNSDFINITSRIILLILRFLYLKFFSSLETTRNDYIAYSSNVVLKWQRMIVKRNNNSNMKDHFGKKNNRLAGHNLPYAALPN